MLKTLAPATWKSKARAAALSLALLAAFAPAPAAADDAAEKFVQQVLDEAEPILAIQDRTAMFDGIEALVDRYVDMRKVGRFVLGKYVRQMTESQAEAYYPLFEQYATQVYQNTLSDYSGERLTVIGSVDRSEKDIVVNSKLVNPEPGDEFANAVIHWRVYRTPDGAMTILDAGADNVWLAIEQRSQFESIIANNGGRAAGIDALIAELRGRVNQ